jgi:hypothetical protein
MKVGILGKVSNDLLNQELRNGWDLVLVESDKGKSMGLGAVGHQLIFKNIYLKERSVSDEFERLGWALLGYNSFIITGTPVEVLVGHVKRVFPSAKIFDAETKAE